MVWGLWSNPRERAAVYCGEMAGGEVREETKVGNGYGGKPRQPRKQGDTAESHVAGGAITKASLPTRQHQQLNSREAGPSNA